MWGFLGSTRLILDSEPSSGAESSTSEAGRKGRGVSSMRYWFSWRGVPGTVSKAKEAPHDRHARPLLDTSLTQDMDFSQLDSEGNISFTRQCSQLFADAHACLVFE